MTGIWKHKLYHMALLRLRQGHIFLCYDFAECFCRS